VSWREHGPPGREGTTWPRTIGILGGLGPHAHVELERLLLRAAESRIGRAASDQDYPPWLLVSASDTPDRTAALHGGPSPVDALVHALRWLAGTSERPGADFAVMACNAAHVWLDELLRQGGLPIVDAPAEALRAALDRAGKAATIGILGTTATIEAQVYPQAARRAGLDARLVTLLDLQADRDAAWLLQEELVMTPVYGSPRDGRRTGGGIKSGRCDLTAAATPLRRAVRSLSGIGADVVVLGCSEIPLALGRDPLDGVTLVDPMEVAARVAIEIAAGDRPLP